MKHCRTVIFLDDNGDETLEVRFDTATAYEVLSTYTKPLSLSEAMDEIEGATEWD
jgi:hypothetical protein